MSSFERCSIKQFGKRVRYSGRRRYNTYISRNGYWIKVISSSVLSAVLLSFGGYAETTCTQRYNNNTARVNSKRDASGSFRIVYTNWEKTCAINYISRRRFPILSGSVVFLF